MQMKSQHCCSSHLQQSSVWFALILHLQKTVSLWTENPPLSAGLRLLRTLCWRVYRTKLWTFYKTEHSKGEIYSEKGVVKWPWSVTYLCNNSHDYRSKCKRVVRTNLTALLVIISWNSDILKMLWMARAAIMCRITSRSSTSPVTSPTNTSRPQNSK